MSSVTPPCGEAVCGAGVGPAVDNGRINFQTSPPILQSGTLPKYYGIATILVVFTNLVHNCSL